MIPARADMDTSAAKAAEVTDNGYQAGGEIGRLHAELAMRLRVPADGLGAHGGDSREALIRRCSIAAGYLTLAAAYTVAAVLLYTN